MTSGPEPVRRSAGPLRRLPLELGKAAFVMFVLELGLMALLENMELSPMQGALLDSFLLAALAMPILWALGFRTRQQFSREDLRTTARGERWTYLALTLQVALVASIAVVYGLSLSGREYSTRVVNLAGRQRMLSHSVAREASLWTANRRDDADSAAKHLSNLRSDSAEIERNFEALIEGDIERDIPRCEDRGLCRRLTIAHEYWYRLRRLLPLNSEDLLEDENEALETSTADLVGLLDHFILLLEERSAEQHSMMSSALQLIVSLATIVSALLVASFISMNRSRKRAVDALRHSEARFRHTLRAAADAILSIDSKGRICEINDAASRMFGWQQDELLGQDPSMLAPEADRDRQRSAIASFFETREGRLSSWHGAELRAVDRSGRVFDVEASFAEIVIDGEQIVTGVFRDVTERKRSQELLSELNSSLAATLDKQRELTIAAKQASMAKSQFLANMSHEIRTPMNAVIGMTSLLLETELDPEQREGIETVRSSGEALLSTINDILDFSKIESGKMTLEQHRFDPRTCVEDALDLFRTTADQKGVYLAALIDGSIPERCIGDSTRLRQVLVNLVGNAMKFTSKGEVIVEVGARRTGSEGAAQQQLVELHFSVRDNGIGIAPDRVEHIFEPFAQADATTTRKFGGTGLGLSICRRLCEMMGGSIRVESEEGRGTTFRFSVSVARDADASPREIEPSLRGLKVLAVDGRSTGRLLIEQMGAGLGIAVSTTETVDDALDRIANEPFGAVIIDGAMCIEDLDRRVREAAGGQSIALITIGTQREKIDASRGKRGHLKTILTRPLRIDRLAEALLGATGAPRSKPSKSDDTDTLLAERHPLSILLAEDNVVNQKVGTRMLQRLGYRADVVSNGLEAIEALENRSYDVILMDIEMPEMNGLEATRIIIGRWSIDRRPWIIAITARAMAGDREECLEAGMNDYLSKPIRLEDLRQTLGRCPLTGSTRSKPNSDRTDPRHPV